MGPMFSDFITDVLHVCFLVSLANSWHSFFSSHLPVVGGFYFHSYHQRNVRYDAFLLFVVEENGGI